METIETIETTSVDETFAFGRHLASRLRRGDCVALIGDLGAGKTALTRGIAAGLGLTQANMVSSPTFVLVQEYPARVRIFHIDLYRMKQPELELPSLGLDEMLQEGIVLIEWADRAPTALPRRHWHVEIAATGQTSRQIEVTPLA
ncbi:MAG: tRNA (adenosine(37)-N6)-threonylcarbamoyltransferase complex ATPase subunit type 1 TsaE [Phycisphaerae bacterium]|nr:tRNA (adenosine(37)-N6)-threonylcarbamoyltransferase complex ATPase subunit type 1 TsaE [Phycisphaerae bacterium]